MFSKKQIPLKSNQEIQAMLASCRLAARTLDMIAEEIQAGVSTLKINDLCHQFICDHKAIPAPLNYKGFPKSVCTSVNDVVCHGIPNKEDVLENGDIINVDVTTILDGYHGDTSRTFFVGDVAPQTKKLVEATKESMMRGIAAVKVGGRVGDIGAAIQSYIEPMGFSVVREFVGHGIGKGFHEEPQIPHYGKAGVGTRFAKGMTFTIEPMVNVGDWRCAILEDDWTAVTVDGRLSAQFEHTIGILEDGSVQILTLGDAADVC